MILPPELRGHPPAMTNAQPSGADVASLPEKREPGGKARRHTADDRRAALKRVAKRRARKGYR